MDKTMAVSYHVSAGERHSIHVMRLNANIMVSPNTSNMGLVQNMTATMLVQSCYSI